MKKIIKDLHVYTKGYVFTEEDNFIVINKMNLDPEAYKKITNILYEK